MAASDPLHKDLPELSLTSEPISTTKTPSTLYPGSGITPDTQSNIIISAVDAHADTDSVGSYAFPDGPNPDPAPGSQQVDSTTAMLTEEQNSHQAEEERGEGLEEDGNEEKRHRAVGADATDVLVKSIRLPRVVITFCTQCRWMLRGAYYAQELISTFSTSLGEVALAPGTGGVFTVELMTGDRMQPNGEAVPSQMKIWDRKVDGGFPETKELKKRIRNIIDPARDLGHVDKEYGKEASELTSEEKKKEQKTPLRRGDHISGPNNERKACEDCS